MVICLIIACHNQLVNGFCFLQLQLSLSDRYTGKTRLRLITSRARNQHSYNIWDPSLTYGYTDFDSLRPVRPVLEIGTHCTTRDPLALTLNEQQHEMVIENYRGALQIDSYNKTRKQVVHVWGWYLVLVSQSREQVAPWPSYGEAQFQIQFFSSSNTKTIAIKTQIQIHTLVP